ncbi:hypothetical protein B0T17DRAFT_372525 [Bombardia bombarda]|uniref:Uncharacterized protein n=1 Tax=Bombardia bombarda TaxID=252184 RepID=A0AA39WGF0_9PEZI|nr:hypothetical protein B0T17DRAFT_372525 [Bombardia bombarda]
MYTATPFRPTMRLAAHAPPTPTAIRMPIARAAPNIIVPSLVVVGTIYGVIAYIRGQLRKESETMNRMFSQQNTPEVQESRRKTLLIDTEGDPRKSIYNLLNW